MARFAECRGLRGGADEELPPVAKAACLDCPSRLGLGERGDAGGGGGFGDDAGASASGALGNEVSSAAAGVLCFGERGEVGAGRGKPLGFFAPCRVRGDAGFGEDGPSVGSSVLVANSPVWRRRGTEEPALKAGGLWVWRCTAFSAVAEEARSLAWLIA